MDQAEYREFFSTLSNFSRMAIVQFLRDRGATVSQIADTLGYEQSRVSHSLARLQRAGLVDCRWEDKRKTFHLTDSVAPLLKDIEAYLTQRPKPSRRAERGWRDNWAGASAD